jgi:hypothetical protein
VAGVADYGYVIYEHEIVPASSMPGGYPGTSQSKRIDWGREAAGPRWLRRVLGDDYFRRVVWLDAAAHDSVFEQLSRLPDIERLTLDAYALRDEDLSTLTALPHLRSLSIYGAPQLTDDGLKHLLAIDLRELYIAHAPISDKAVETLSKLKGLERLTLRHTEITEEGERKLKRLLSNTLYMPQVEARGYVAPHVPNKPSGRFTPNHKVRD